MPLLNDPWLVALVGAPIGAVLAGLILFYLIGYLRKQRTKTDLMSRVNNADQSTDALLMYEDLLEKVSVAEHSDVYARIKNNQGIRYGELAWVRDKEENITKAIRAHEQALKITTVEKYPLYYKVVVSNMSRVKQRMKAEHQ